MLGLGVVLSSYNAMKRAQAKARAARVLAASTGETGGANVTASGIAQEQLHRGDEAARATAKQGVVGDPTSAAGRIPSAIEIATRWRSGGNLQSPARNRSSEE